ncbi:hypothetical protein ACMXYQ_06935 [Neptuniibacter sp. PT34_22]|uniref:hypothetical protein n=1 Tax=Neptuniibacter sp. PT34_22 TaxID=3398205 RepID=UPI0039F5C26E
MQCSRLFSITLLMLFLASPNAAKADKHPLKISANEKPIIVWARTDFAPVFILKGKYSNQGIGDEAIKLFKSKLKHYNHISADMSLKRAMQLAKEGQMICHVSLVNSKERQQFMDFSQPLMRLYANGLVTTKGSLHKFGVSADKINPVSLTALTQKPVSISIHDARAYSAYIDEVIKKNRSKPNSIFKVKTGQKDQERLIQMVENHRLDAMIGRPEEAQFSKLQHNIKEDLYFVPLKGQPETSMGHIGCAKGDWNKALINTLNQMIEKDEELKSTIFEAYQKWLPSQLRTTREAFNYPLIPQP